MLLRTAIRAPYIIGNYKLSITNHEYRGSINESNEREFVVTVHKNMNVAISGFNS